MARHDEAPAWQQDLVLTEVFMPKPSCLDGVLVILPAIIGLGISAVLEKPFDPAPAGDRAARPGGLRP